MTPAQQDIAHRLLSLGERVAFMTARQLAEAVGQSDAAVVRFAKAVGYSGLPEMRNALRERILDEVGASGMRRAGLDLHGFAEGMAADHAELVSETVRLNEEASVGAVVDALIAARRIYVSAHGTTYPLAAYLAMHLNQSLDNTEIFTIGHGDLADRFRSIGPGDVFVGIGYARYLPYTLDVLRLAREAGATVVAITDRVTSPLAALAGHKLYPARAGASPAWWSQAGTLFLADWLNALVLSRSEGAAAHLRRSDEEWRRLGHWKGDGDSLGQHRDRAASPQASRRSSNVSKS